VNAIRDIATAKETEIRLQSNQVFVHLPADTPLAAVPDAIYDAGYAPDDNVWLLAQGQWSADGFQPEGWDRAIPIPDFSGENGLWQIHFEKKDGTWTFTSAEPLEKLPELRDENI
jgi:hypothetical protein